MKPKLVIAHPVSVLKCPNCGAEFDHKLLEGKKVWIVWDLRKENTLSGAICSICKKRMKGPNITVDQGFVLFVLPDGLHPRGGHFKWSETYLLTPEDVGMK